MPTQAPDFADVVGNPPLDLEILVVIDQERAAREYRNRSRIKKQAATERRDINGVNVTNRRVARGTR